MMEKEKRNQDLFLDCYLQLEEEYRQQAEQMLRECAREGEKERGIIRLFDTRMAAGS
ncbi:hypothetical protein LJC49_09135 [Ruminococcaceae bacterium OttesenSCG-928-I18]|nr:hypothetical protein [Ruminococcaceae bacterium OttesenSCG-928-I18]